MIVVGGEALVDLVLAADGSLAAHLGGGPYNTARTIARLGVEVAFLGRVSTDRFGRNVRSSLLSDGVHDDLVVSTQDPTTLALAELDERGAASYRFYIEHTSAPGLTASDALAKLPDDLYAVHVGTLGLVLEPMASAYQVVIERVAGNALVMVDVNCRPVLIDDRVGYWSRVREVLRNTDIVKVSDEDLAFLALCAGGHLTIEDVLALGPSVVLLTKGADGVDVVTARGAEHVAAPPTKVVDTIGAGDSFGGGFLSWWHDERLGRTDLADRDLLRRAATFAARVAAVTCERAGADPPWRHEL